MIKAHHLLSFLNFFLPKKRRFFIDDVSEINTPAFISKETDHFILARIATKILTLRAPVSFKSGIELQGQIVVESGTHLRENKKCWRS